MKKIICLISLILAEYLFADVLNSRVDDGNVHYGLPEWVSLSDNLYDETWSDLPDNYALFKKIVPFESDGKTQDYRTSIDFSESYSFEFLGKKYTSLVVHANGQIEFGSENDESIKRPYVNTTSFAGAEAFKMGETFEWGIYSQKVDDNRENFLVINFGPFKYHSSYQRFSIQTLIYPNGEVHIQYWNHDKISSMYEGWMFAKFFDGYGFKTARVNAASVSYVDIYGTEGLRPGWVAKPLRSEYSVDISEPQKGAGLYVQMQSASNDLGGIIAYDYSREHPVVGGISSVEVVTSSLPTEAFSPLYCWYFNEYFHTNFARIPKWLSNENTSLVLNRDDYEYTWNAYKTNPDKKSIVLRTDETIDYIGAPAFKFQRVSSGSSMYVYDFYIKRIRYNLAQPQSMQFMPLRRQRAFSVENSNGGLVEFSDLKGITDTYNSYKKKYELYPGQEIKGSIITSPGYMVDKITVTYALNGLQKNVIYDGDVLLKKYDGGLNFSIQVEKKEILINGAMSDFNVILNISYKKCETRELPLVIPDMVKMETYSAPHSSSDNRIISSAVIYNAFGGVAQKQKMVAKGEYAVLSEYSNRMNQKTRVPMTFVHKSSTNDFEYVDMACENCITEANAYYYKRSEESGLSNPISTEEDIDRPDAENNAFTEIRYFNGNSKGNGAVAASAGVAKRSFAFNGNSYAIDYEMPAFSKYDFISHNNLNESALSDIYSKRNQNRYNANFVLKIHRDSEGKFTQEIFDSQGLKIASWYFDGQRELIDVYEYDEFGNLEKAYNKDYSYISYKATYDAQGRVKSVESNDRGTILNSYDSKGRLRFVKTPLHRDGCFVSYFFDKLGRTVAVGEVSEMSSDAFENADIDIPESKIRYVSKTIYGKPGVDELVSFGVNRSLAQSIVNKMTYIRPNDLGAVISYDEKGKMVSIKISEYDRIGQKQYQWVILGLSGVPAIQLSYGYNLSGDLTESVFSQWNGSDWIKKTTRTREYDENGRLISTAENGAMIALYEYTKNGNVYKKKYYDNENLVFEKIINRDVYNRPTKIIYLNKKRDEIYSETLDFKSVESSQIANTAHEWKSVKGNDDFSRASSYDYDYSGRLTSVAGALSGSYGYDALGRITKKIEGDTSIGYAYTRPSYRPTGVNVNGGSPASSAVYLKYDAAGNVWYDKNNHAVYKIGKNNMPTKVFKFTSMPDGITLNDVNDEADVLNGAVEKIDIVYDESGDRIWYSYDNVVGGSGFTRVILPGVGIYEAERTNGLNGLFNLVRHDLVAGGYRDAGGNAHFPVTDAQGNVRGYATTEGLESAYDYYAYGTVDNLAPNAGDDNKRWQDKEYDGEHGKYYFGSRYFDPFFGLWMSPDPAGQFANPYTYGGDPLNYIDPDGEFAFVPVLVAAAIGAVVGGTAAAYQCSKYGAGSCSVGITQGSVVGAAAGAAGAAAGGAAAAYGAAYGSMDAAVASGLASGAASSATSYVGNGLFTGQMSWGEGIRDVMFGAFSGVATASLGMNGYNILGKNGAEILGGATFGGIGSMIHGGGFWDGFGNGALMSAASAFLNTAIDKVLDAGSYDGAIPEDGSGNLREGDLVVFESDGSVPATIISWLTGEDYTHTAYVERGSKGDVFEDELFFREATNEGEEIGTSINHYKGRRFKVIGNKMASRSIIRNENGMGILGRNKGLSNFWNGYNLFTTNCTSQATRWTGLRYTNNPGVLARYMGAARMPYYNNLSLQSMLW